MLGEDDDGAGGLLDDIDDDPADSPMMKARQRASMASEDQGQSAKLALVEARVELDDLRKDLIAAQADRAAARLEQKADKELAQLAAQRNEAAVRSLRHEIEVVRETLQVGIVEAEDAAHAAMEAAKERERALHDELAQARGATEVAAVSMIQRVFNKRWTRVLQERCRSASAQAEAATAEAVKLAEELEDAQRAAQSSATRTLQRALRVKMKGAIRAASGDMKAFDAMHEERRMSDVRSLEKEQAELRSALNEARRRAAALNKSVQKLEGGHNFSVDAVRRMLTTARVAMPTTAPSFWSTADLSPSSAPASAGAAGAHGRAL